MIRTYGLFWAADQVFWGRQNNPGSLLGAKSRSLRGASVDFRLQRGIYALYAEYDLVYVGQTGAGKDRLFYRLNCHRKDHLSERWDRFSWFGTRWVTQQHRLSLDTAAVQARKMPEVLNILEAVTTAIASPRLNLQRGRWGDSKQYYQVMSPETRDD